KALSTMDAVGNAGPQQGFLKRPRLGVGAVEDGNVLPAITVLTQCLFDHLDNIAGLVLLVEGLIKTYGFTIRVTGPQVLAQPFAVVADQGVGGLENGGAGAVVLLQADGLGLWKVLVELLDVFDAGAAPAVNGLVVVTDNHQAAGIGCEQTQPGVLHSIGILEFID